MKFLLIVPERLGAGGWRVFTQDGTELSGVHVTELWTKQVETALTYRPMAEGGSVCEYKTVAEIALRFDEVEVERISEPPPSLEARLRALAAKWSEGSAWSSADREDTAAEVAREKCAEELEALLNEAHLTPPNLGV